MAVDSSLYLSPLLRPLRRTRDMALRTLHPPLLVVTQPWRWWLLPEDKSVCGTLVFLQFQFSSICVSNFIYWLLCSNDKYDFLFSWLDSNCYGSLHNHFIIIIKLYYGYLWSYSMIFWRGNCFSSASLSENNSIGLGRSSTDYHLDFGKSTHK